MTRLIEKTNDREPPMLVWVDPFGVPVYVDQNETLRFEFDCSEAEILSSEFGAYHSLAFPPECRPRVTIQRPQEVVAVDLPSPRSVSAKDVSGSELQFQGLIAHLGGSIMTTSDLQVGDDCAEALNKIGNIAAIEALFSVYNDVQECLAESLQPRIIYWLNLCTFDTPEKRDAGLQHLEFLRSLIAQAPEIAPESCRRAFYLMSKMQEDSSETIDLIINLIERIALPATQEWKVTWDAALLFVEKRSSWRITRSATLRESLGDNGSFNMALFCPICKHYRQRPGRTGEICPVCKFEFDVDDYDYRYFPPPRRK